MKKTFLLLLTLLTLNLASQAQGGWDAHIAKLTSALPKCTAALYGLDGTLWTKNSVSLSADEAKYIIFGFANPAQLFANGPKVNGVKFMATKADDHLIVLKHGMDGLICKKSAKAVTICKFSEGNTTPAQATVATSNFADYMKTIGY